MREIRSSEAMATDVLDDRVRFAVGFIFLILFFVLLATWIFAWAAFHVAGGLIHLVLLLAFISLIIHVFRGGRRSV